MCLDTADVVRDALIILSHQFEDLMNVKGIGEKRFLKLKPLITVTTDRAAAAQK